MKGVFAQCNHYGYDVVVISALVSVCNYYKNYLNGELNIYNLINFDLFDGFIITPVPMTEDQNFFLYERLLKQFKNCPKPLVSLDKEFGDFPVIYTDDKTPFKRITEHLIKKHNCHTFDILSGPDDAPLTNMRLNGVLETLTANDIPLDSSHVYRGDYWYSGGERLANRYISGELDLPDAVICLSDHMALGLINRLKKQNIKVPEDVIVTGFGAVREAAINTPPVTSYVPSQAKTGAEAVNYLREIIDPAASIAEYKDSPDTELKLGASCGCEEDFSYTRAYFKDDQPGTKYNYDDSSIWDNITMTMLEESYMAENLTGADTPQICLGKIYETKYLLKPYKRFYLCLNDTWLNTDSDIIEGYSDNILLSVFAEANSKLHGWNNHVFADEENKRPFPKEKMLPAFEEELNEGFTPPQVYYFAPIHFGNISLGYAVLQNDLSAPGLIGEVFRNYLRNVNNALEMSRTKYRSIYLAEHDAMTGLKNRRGMKYALQPKMQAAAEGAKIFAIVIDMDDLKKRNDLHGHSEGDNGIMVIARAAQSISDEGEICVRGGGDEFLVLGVGSYTDQQMREKLSRFHGYLETANETMAIPVEASIGYALQTLDKNEGYQVVLDKADEKMYEDKRTKKSAEAKKR
jgi:diguanylate cyclase (GGDEF)-like protein